MKIDPADLRHLEALPLLTRCGVPEPVALPFPARQVAGRHAMIAAMARQSWDRAQLEARNDLTGWLAVRHTNDYQRWNEVVLALRPGVERVADAACRALAEPDGLPDTVRHSVRWDLLAVLMERVYARKGSPRFFTELLAVYEAGHLPCGWEGRWPEGTLLYW